LSDFPRREISEIIEIASRETDVVSVFVEGKFDKGLLEKYLKCKGLDQIISVYAIDTIDVPNELVASAGLNLKSNKSRVVTLSIEVSGSEADVSSRAICVVDADCDRELGSLRKLAALRYTDFTCMEMYGLDRHVLADICKFSWNLSDTNIAEVTQLMDAVLPTLFALRCCNEELGLSGNMPAITSGFGKKKGNRQPDFMPEKYVDLFIQQNRLIPRRQEILELFTTRFGKLSADIRNKAHGHDTVKLFYLYLNREKVLNLTDEEIEKVGNRIFLSGIDFNQLDAFELFRNIFVPVPITVAQA
jgi:hypothetical protein